MTTSTTAGDSGRLRDAMRYPTRGDYAEEAFLIGWILGLLSVFLLELGLQLLPLSISLQIPVVGYFVRVLDTSTTGDPTLPRFDGWRRLATDGLVAVAVVAAYLLVPVALLSVTVAGLRSGTAGGSQLGTGRALAVLGGSTATFVTGLAFVYVLPVALASVATADGVRAAVRFDRITPVARDVEYFVNWVRMAVVLATGWGMAGLLSTVSRFGAVFAVILAFYATVVACRLLGQAYGDTMGVATSE